MNGPIYAEIDLRELLGRIHDKDKLGIIKALIQNISEEGYIEPIRDLVNDSTYND